MTSSKKISFAVSLVVMSLLLGCYLGRILPPKAQNHPQPTLHVVTDAPWEAGCTQDPSTSACAVDSPLGALGCDRVQPPGDLLGGLEPALPISLCLTRPEPGTALDRNAYLYREGCMVPEYVRYAVWRDGQFGLLESQADMAALYAPVVSQDEALSYALAVTGFGVRYGLQPVKGFRYFVDELQDTHVIEVDEGYRVLLYDYHFCGCGPHTTDAVWVQVSRDGAVKEVDRQAVFEDPAEDGLCVD